MSNVYVDQEDEHAQDYNSDILSSNQRSNEGVRRRPRKGGQDTSRLTNGY